MFGQRYIFTFSSHLHHCSHSTKPITAMYSKIVAFAATLAFVNAGYLQPALRFAAPAVAYHAAPLVSYTSPAITKTDFIPGSYSSSYRSDVITPRVKYTETPALSVAVHQPAIALPAHPVARIAPLLPHAAPLVQGYAAPFARGYAWA